MRDSLEELLRVYNSYKELDKCVDKYMQVVDEESKRIFIDLKRHAIIMFNSYSNFVKGESYDPNSYDTFKNLLYDDIRSIRTIPNLSQEDVNKIADKIRTFLRLAVPISSNLGSEGMNK